MTNAFTRVGLLALLLLPFTAGCVSQQRYMELESENVRLREERTRVNRTNDQLSRQIASYEAQLQAANQRIDEAPALSDMSELEGQGVNVFRRGNSVVFSVPAEISFASGKAELSASGRAALKSVASKLKSDFPDGVYWIEGHTDNDPIRKSGFGSNRDLSLARAMSVLRGLVDDNGIPDEKCVVAGYGQYWPDVPNDSAANKAKNRRVEVIVHQARGDE